MLFVQKPSSKKYCFSWIPTNTTDHFFSCCDLSITSNGQCANFSPRTNASLNWCHPFWSISIPYIFCNFCLCFGSFHPFLNLMNECWKYAPGSSNNIFQTIEQESQVTREFVVRITFFSLVVLFVVVVELFAVFQGFFLFMLQFFCFLVFGAIEQTTSCQFSFEESFCFLFGVDVWPIWDRKLRLWLQQSWNFEKTWFCVHWWKRRQFLFLHLFRQLLQSPQGIMITPNCCLWCHCQTNNSINKKHKQPKVSEWHNVVKQKKNRLFFENDEPKLRSFRTIGHDKWRDCCDNVIAVFVLI